MASFTKRAFAGFALAALGATSLAACGSDDEPGGTGSGTGNQSDAKGGTLTYLIEDPIEHLDPQRIYVGRDITNTTRTVYRSLVTFTTGTEVEAGSTPVPDLATDTGTSSEGGKTWSFTIKDGVKWEDGQDITCEDFKYGASRGFATDVITGGPNYLLSYLDVPKGADGLPAYKGPYTGEGQELFDEAVTCEGQTITYHFNKPWPDLPLAVASLKMLDPFREDKDQGDRSNLQIFSNGPYKLEGEWSKNSGGTLVRNTNYDETTDSTEIRKALPEKIVFKIGDTPEVTYDQLFGDSGAAQTSVTSSEMPPSYYSRIPEAEDRYLNPDSPYVYYLVPNFDNMTDVKVRQALALATNKEAWINAGGGERAAAPADSIVNPVVAGYAPNPAFADIPLEGDIEGAKKLLSEAGVTTPYPIIFTYPQTDTRDKQAAALKDTWDQAGFEVTLDPLGDTYYDIIQKPKKESDVMWGGWGADWPSLTTDGPALFDSRPNISTESLGQDYGAYKSTKYEALVDQAANSATLDEANKYLQEGDVVLGEDVTYIPLNISKFNWLHGSKVTNFAVTPASSSFPDLGLIGVES